MSLWCYCCGGRKLSPPRRVAFYASALTCPIEISSAPLLCLTAQSPLNTTPVSRPHASTFRPLPAALHSLLVTMAVTPRTTEFRRAVQECQNTIPDAKRRKLSRPSKRSTPESERLEALNKEYMKEAYNVVSMSYSTQHQEHGVMSTQRSSIILVPSLECCLPYARRT